MVHHIPIYILAMSEVVTAITRKGKVTAFRDVNSCPTLASRLM